MASEKARIDYSGKRLSAKEIREAEIALLLKFDELCKSKDLQYTLSGGTLLGAIRHGGFIPWDDDIDVNMPRPAFDRLVELLKSDYMHGYDGYFFRAIVEGMKDPVYLKFCDPFISVKEERAAKSSNLWIDIFPMDGLPEKTDEVAYVYRRADRCRRALVATMSDYAHGSTPFKRVAKRIFIPIARATGIDILFAKRLVGISKEIPYGETAYIGGIAWGLYGVGERVSARAFENCVTAKFEGHEFPIMACWREYLEGLYGDYMTLPPLENRICHEMIAWRIDRGGA